MDTTATLIKDDIQVELESLAYDLGYFDSCISLFHIYEKIEKFNESLAKFDFHFQIKFKQAVDIRTYLQKDSALMNQYILGYVDAILNQTQLGSSFIASLEEDDIYPSFVGFTLNQNELIENLLVEQIDFEINAEHFSS